METTTYATTMVDFILDRTNLDPSTVEASLKNINVIPAEAQGYLMGQLASLFPDPAYSTFAQDYFARLISSWSSSTILTPAWFVNSFFASLVSLLQSAPYSGIWDLPSSS